jgi:hypothetical protein
MFRVCRILVCPHVINLHGGGENGWINAKSAFPFSAHRNIHNQEKFRVKGPLCRGFMFIGEMISLRSVDIIIQVYRLKGYNEAWSAWSTKTEKDYTNLPGGQYAIEVKARDNFFNEWDTAAYSFNIKPPWYKTTLAIACYLIAFGILLFLLNRWHTKRLQLLQRKFEERQNSSNIFINWNRKKMKKKS